ELCNIFAEVLGLDKVGVNDNFFRIGGDSIVSIQLSSKLRRNGIDCSVRDIFDYRTISKLAKYLSSREEIESKIIQEQGILEGELGLLPIQEWFLDRVNSGEFKAYNHWNQSFLVKVPELDVSRLNVIVEKLVSHHDILRTNYVKQDAGYTQVYRSSIDIPELRLLDVSRLSDKAISKRLTKWQNNFDIHNGPLWSIGYLHGFKDGSARIYFALHHLIIDAVSWRILIEDFKSLYNNEELSAKGTSYRQYINLVKEYADNNKHQLDYWNNILTNIPSYPEICSKPCRGEVCLNKSQTESLLQNGNKAYHTEINDLLLSALGYALRDINRSDIQVITLEGHGREHIQEGVELNYTVGWFTTMYPALLEIKEDLGSTIKHIKESLRSIPNKGIGFGSFAQSSNEIDFKQLPRVSFNYLGQFDGREGLWQLVSESSGINMNLDNQDHNIININGLVVDGQLSFSVVTQLGKKITDKLARTFQESLIQIQEHTQRLVDQGEEYYTPSDLLNFKPYEVFGDTNENVIFIFPPAEGGAESYYNNLIPELSKTYKVIAFNNIFLEMINNLDQNVSEYISINELKKYYLSLILRDFANVKTAIFLGWSLGGVIAFEVCKNLQSNMEIKSLLLIDSIFRYELCLKKLNIKDYKNINYRYALNVNKNEKLNFPISLFKCMKLKRNLPTFGFFNYYKNIYDNHLSSLASATNIYIIELEQSNHYDWVKNERDITSIIDHIKLR
ncbi:MULTISPECIES: condensation domain-containing protein, partial [unclassified Francisella]|uniref:condensation domain-containing protein n=1 Tax=unclassified Francisella TaxID=2610885 RepID=UPI002E37331F